MVKIDSFIDYTVVSPDLVKDDIIKVCAEARAYKFASVCVTPLWTKLVSKELNGSSIANCVLIAFPLGTIPLENKIAEIIVAKENGATEYDIVLDISNIKEKNEQAILYEIESILKIVKDAKVKLIIETCLLSDVEKIFICNVINKTSIKYINTSTGLSFGGATNADIQLLKEHLSLDKNVKASGGIKTYKECLSLIDAGADRLGTSQGVSIILEEQQIFKGDTNETV